jgi:hypothetical protein
MRSPQEFDSYFKLFEWELDKDGNNYAPDWVLYKSEDAVLKLRDKAASYPPPVSVSHFLRAFSELKASGTIKKLREPKADLIEEPELTVEQYRSTPTRTIVFKYSHDPVYRSQVDSLIARGLIILFLCVCVSGVF